MYKRDQVCIIQVHTWRKTHPGFDSLHPIVVVLRCNPLIKVPFRKFFPAKISSGWWIIVFLCNLLHLNIGWSCEEMRGEDWRRERDIKYSSITSNLRDWRNLISFVATVTAKVSSKSSHPQSTRWWNEMPRHAREIYLWTWSNIQMYVFLFHVSLESTLLLRKMFYRKLN